MAIASDALPIQFWPVSGQTFNEEQIAFMQKRAFYQEFLDSDTIKLQVSSESDPSNNYGLRIVDINGNQLALIPFTKSVLGSAFCFDLEFTFASLSLPDQYVRFYICLTQGSLDPDTLDSSTLDTYSASLDDIWKSDYVLFSSVIPLNAGYGTRLIYYNSTKNWADIKYPNNGHYFQVRVPSGFYIPREIKTQNALPLSNGKVVTTSIVKTQQQLFQTVLLPQFFLTKLERILEHCVAGSVVIDGIEWQFDDSFDRGDVDRKSQFDNASTWLTKGVARNII